MRKFPLDSSLLLKKKPLRTCQGRKDFFSIKWVFAILGSRLFGGLSTLSTNVLPSLRVLYSMLRYCPLPEASHFLSLSKNFSVGAITKYVVKLINDLVRHEKKSLTLWTLLPRLHLLLLYHNSNFVNMTIKGPHSSHSSQAKAALRRPSGKLTTQRASLLAASFSAALFMCH